MLHLPLSFLVFLVLVPSATPSFGIPGTTQTISGYDTELGEDPICWRSNASSVEGAGGDGVLPFPNPLVKDFNLLGEVALLRTCPALNYLTGEAPLEFQRGERLRTGQVYDYKVSITLNIRSLGGNVFVSDEGPLIGVQVLMCKLGAGFCSPFIHEEANARLAKAGILTPPNKGDSHGGSHTHSGFNFFKVAPEDGPIYKLVVPIPMLVNNEGDYFAVVSAQMYIGEDVGEPAILRYDMASALPGDMRLISYQDPADIQVVPDSVLIISYVAIGIAALVILFLLVETIKNRNHQVLRLTQGYFLIVFLVAALVLVVASFLFEPKNDFYCNASFPIVLISAQLLYAITIGRLWRINAVISPLLMKTLRQKKGWGRRMMDYLSSITSCEAIPRRRKPKNLRKQISHWQLAAVIALFTLPQVVIQVLSLILQPQSLMIQYNEDESEGRVMCDSGLDMKASLRDYGFWVFLMLILLLLFMAQTTSQLPSLFNETKVIYESALFSIVLLLMGLGVIVVTDDPSTSPAVGYLVCVVWALSIATNTSLRIMLPKLQMVWRNEKVVVSKLVSDHSKSVRQEDERYRSSTQSSCVVSGLTPHEEGTPSTRISTGHSTAHSNSIDVANEMVSDYEEDHGHGHSHTSVLDVNDEERVDGKHSSDEKNTEIMESTPGSSSELATPGSMGRPKPRNEDSFKRRLSSLPSKRRNLSNRILVKCDEPPARRLVLKMVDLQEQLAVVNDRIMSGVVVSEEGWTSVRRLANRLVSTLNDDVDFSWEENEDGEEPAGTGKKDSSSKELIQEMIIEEGTEEEPEHRPAVRFQGDERNGNEAAPI
jgi:cadmium resistance protein CadD (predicted permease)